MPIVEPTELQFEQALEFFRQKLNIPSERWNDIWQEEHDYAFTVAGAMLADLLEDLRAAVQQAIEGEVSRDEFIRQFEEIATRRGWAYRGEKNWRANIIFQTNLRTAYAAGRYQQMTDPEILNRRPYWMWIHGDSRIPRPLHRALHGRVFSADSSFWDSMYPPCGFGCKCQAVSLSKRDVERRGLTVEDPPEIGSIITANDNRGRPHALRVEPDPGWGHITGRTRPEQREQMLNETLSRLSPEMREQVRNREENR